MKTIDATTEEGQAALVAVNDAPLRCLGPREQNLDRLIERLKKGRRPADRRSISAEARKAVIDYVKNTRDARVKTTDAVIHQTFVSGNLPLARVLKSYANLGCNYDLRELIAAFPRDGKLRTEPCPKCKRGVTFITPSVDDQPK